MTKSKWIVDPRVFKALQLIRNEVVLEGESKQHENSWSTNTKYGEIITLKVFDTEEEAKKELKKHLKDLLSVL